MDIGMIAKLLKNPSDLPAAAKALGMEHVTVPPGERTAAVMECLARAFSEVAEIAQRPGTEVINLHGAPALLKGKKVRILAVLED